jgi:hypothetical protein
MQVWNVFALPLEQLPSLLQAAQGAEEELLVLGPTLRPTGSGGGHVAFGLTDREECPADSESTFELLQSRGLTPVLLAGGDNTDSMDAYAGDRHWSMDARGELPLSRLWGFDVRELRDWAGFGVTGPELCGHTVDLTDPTLPQLPPRQKRPALKLPPRESWEASYMKDALVPVDTRPMLSPRPPAREIEQLSAPELLARLETGTIAIQVLLPSMPARDAWTPALREALRTFAMDALCDGHATKVRKLAQLIPDEDLEDLAIDQILLFDLERNVSRALILDDRRLLEHAILNPKLPTELLAAVAKRLGREEEMKGAQLRLDIVWNELDDLLDHPYTPAWTAKLRERAEGRPGRDLLVDAVLAWYHHPSVDREDVLRRLDAVDVSRCAWWAARLRRNHDPRPSRTALEAAYATNSLSNRKRIDLGILLAEEEPKRAGELLERGYLALLDTPTPYSDAAKRYMKRLGLL